MPKCKRSFPIKRSEVAAALRLRYEVFNRELGEKVPRNPEAYSPQFGGYWSYAVSEGYTADGDPEAWKVVDGKLYLNYNKQVKEKWQQNQDERIERGRDNWREFKKKTPEHKG